MLLKKVLENCKKTDTKRVNSGNIFMHDDSTSSLE